jgi:membrane fusion protein (multidrug efflux system)
MAERMSQQRNRFKIMMGLAGAVTVLVLILALIFLREESPNATTPGPGTDGGDASALPVQVMKPQRQDLTYTITLPGNISPWYQATLYAKVPGYLTWMGFDKGDSVKKGQLLAVIDAPEVEQHYRQAEADYAIKRITAQRLKNVWKENPEVIAKQDVDVAEAAAEGAKHLRDNRHTMLDYTKVYAPFSGVITARFADPGALIQSAAVSATQAVPLYTLMDLDTVRVYVSVPQEVALLAKAGVQVVLNFKELPGQEFKGSITRTTEALDPATRTLLVEIDMPNKERQLQPGTFVSATLYLREHPNALAIPPAAIVTGGPGQGKSVFVVEQGKARRVPIKTDIDDGVWVEVVDGLTGNEDIVVVGKAGLTEGQAVKASVYNLPSGKPSSQKY